MGIIEVNSVAAGAKKIVTISNDLKSLSCINNNTSKDTMTTSLSVKTPQKVTEKMSSCKNINENCHMKSGSMNIKLNHNLRQKNLQEKCLGLGEFKSDVMNERENTNCSQTYFVTGKSSNSASNRMSYRNRNGNQRSSCSDYSRSSFSNEWDDGDDDCQVGKHDDGGKEFNVDGKSTVTTNVVSQSSVIDGIKNMNLNTKSKILVNFDNVNSADVTAVGTPESVKQVNLCPTSKNDANKVSGAIQSGASSSDEDEDTDTDDDDDETSRGFSRRPHPYKNSDAVPRHQQQDSRMVPSSGYSNILFGGVGNGTTYASPASQPNHFINGQQLQYYELQEQNTDFYQSHHLLSYNRSPDNNCTSNHSPPAILNDFNQVSSSGADSGEVTFVNSPSSDLVANIMLCYKTMSPDSTCGNSSPPFSASSVSSSPYPHGENSNYNGLQPSCSLLIPSHPHSPSHSNFQNILPSNGVNIENKLMSGGGIISDLSCVNGRPMSHTTQSEVVHQSCVMTSPSHVISNNLQIQAGTDNMYPSTSTNTAKSDREDCAKRNMSTCSKKPTSQRKKSIRNVNAVDSDFIKGKDGLRKIMEFAKKNEKDFIHYVGPSKNLHKRADEQILFNLLLKWRDIFGVATNAGNDEISKPELEKSWCFPLAKIITLNELYFKNDEIYSAAFPQQVLPDYQNMTPIQVAAILNFRKPLIARFIADVLISKNINPDQKIHYKNGNRKHLLEELKDLGNQEVIDELLKVKKADGLPAFVENPPNADKVVQLPHFSEIKRSHKLNLINENASGNFSDYHTEVSLFDEGDEVSSVNIEAILSENYDLPTEEIILEDVLDFIETNCPNVTESDSTVVLK